MAVRTLDIFPTAVFAITCRDIVRALIFTSLWTQGKISTYYISSSNRPLILSPFIFGCRGVSTALACFPSSSSSAMTIDNLGIFVWAESFWAAMKSGYVVPIPSRYTASLRSAGRFSPELDSFSTLIWKSALYAVIDLNEAAFVVTKWLNRVKGRTNPFSLYCAVYAY